MGLYQLITVQTRCVFIVTDAQGKTLWFNELTTDLCGYEIAEAWGEKPGRLLQGAASDKRTVCQMSQAVKQGAPFQGRIVNYHKSGRPYEVEIHFAPFINRLDEVEYFIATEAEITPGMRTKRKEELAAELDAVLRELIQTARLPS